MHSSELGRRHAERFLEFALGAETKLSGPDQTEWLNRLERELDNLRAAIDWLLASKQLEDALRATAALSRFWRGHGHMAEARRLLALGLELGTDVAPAVRADALWAAARQAAAQSDWPAAEELLEEALPLFRHDERGREVAFTLSELAFLAVRRDDLDRGAELCEESLAVARALGDARATSAALLTLAEIRSHPRAVTRSRSSTTRKPSLSGVSSATRYSSRTQSTTLVGWLSSERTTGEPGPLSANRSAARA